MRTVYDFRLFEDEIKKNGKWVNGFSPTWLAKQAKHPSIAYRVTFQDDDPRLQDFLAFLSDHLKKALANFSIGRRYSETEFQQSNLIHFSSYRVPKPMIAVKFLIRVTK